MAVVGTTSLKANYLLLRNDKRIARDKVDGPVAVVRNVGGNKIARDKVVGLWPWFALLEPKWLWMKTRSTTMMIAICFKIRRPSGSMIPKHHKTPREFVESSAVWKI